MVENPHFHWKDNQSDKRGGFHTQVTNVFHTIKNKA